MHIDIALDLEEKLLKDNGKIIIEINISNDGVEPTICQPEINNLTFIRTGWCSCHWSKGGTGLVNFTRSELRVYQEAIRRYNNKVDPTNIMRAHYWISIKPMEAEVDHMLPPLYSLHHDSEAVNNNCTSFWHLYEQARRRYLGLASY